MNIFESALKMELDGEQFYTEQAAKNEGNSLETVFRVLAKTEKKHADLIKKHMGGETIAKQALDLQSEENVFTNLNEFKAEVTSIPRQLDVYRFALDIEKKSIDHYNDLLAKAQNDQDKDLLQFLISQETNHYDLFATLIEIVSRPEEWVEDAEFGQRQEY